MCTARLKHSTYETQGGFFPACHQSISICSQEFSLLAKTEMSQHAVQDSVKRVKHKSVCQHVTDGEKASRHAKTQWKSYPIRDKSTQRDRFTLKHKHNIGTDLEAPVVWLLLGGGGEEKQRAKETERGQGG